jgi:penicillin G amidase
MKSSFPILKRFALFVFLPLLVMLVWLYVHGRQGLPPSMQTVQVPGGGSVRIVRDERGVPHLYADRDEDIYFAMGYVQAQDRLWQMELQRRLATGRLSEIFGKDLLMQDSWMRTLGLRSSAQSVHAALSEPARQSLEAYARGVNAWLREGHPLPLEFGLFRVRPEPWSAIDSLSWGKVFSLSLSGNLDQEIGKSMAARYLHPLQVKSFFPGESEPTMDEGERASHASLASLGTLSNDLHLDWNIGGREVGSNGWVVAGRHTADGGALLANDPHLGLQMPSPWYPVVQHGAQLHAQGMSLVGLPPVIFGQNGQIAWGGTAMHADVQDLVVQHFDPKDPDRYLVDGKWLPVERRIEEISVASEFPSFLHPALKPVRIEVRSTRDGPIVSDLRAKAIGQPLALRWTALQAGDRSYESMYAVSYAKDWETFKATYRHYVTPALNMLYADRDGNIGYLGIGAIPIRRKGDGSLPVPGWNADFAWQGQIPFDAMPSRYNPPEGYIASANERPIDDSYPYFISNDWAPPARAQRIRELLKQAIASGRRLKLEDMQAIQTDERSLSAARLVPVLIAIEPANEDERKALELLKGWSGDMSASSAGAALFNVWMRHLSAQLFGGALGDDWVRHDEMRFVRGVLDMATVDQIERALTDPQAPWCKPQASESSDRSCRGVLRASLGQALAELQRRIGKDEADWRWGDIHHALYAHQPFSNIRGLSGLFERRVDSGGGPDTINVSGFSVDGTNGYIGHFGASSRQVIALGRQGVQHRYMNSTGQSGNWMSAHYADMVEPFTRGDYYLLTAGDKK